MRGEGHVSGRHGRLWRRGLRDGRPVLERRFVCQSSDSSPRLTSRLRRGIPSLGETRLQRGARVLLIWAATASEKWLAIQSPGSESQATGRGKRAVDLIKPATSYNDLRQQKSSQVVIPRRRHAWYSIKSTGRKPTRLSRQMRSLPFCAMPIPGIELVYAHKKCPRKSRVPGGRRTRNLFQERLDGSRWNHRWHKASGACPSDPSQLEARPLQHPCLRQCTSQSAGTCSLGHVPHADFGVRKTVRFSCAVHP